MTNDGIKIELIKVKDLPKFAENIIYTAKPGQFIPITKQRATAHAANPYADEDDVGLLAAIDDDDEVVGYFGILPMLLRIENKKYKTHWFTTWSVSPKVRGKGVGSLLMKEALTLNLDFLIVGSVHARRVCQKFGFLERDPLKYYWIDISGMGKLNPIVWFLRLIRKLVHIGHWNIQIPTTNSATKSVDRLLSPLTTRFFYPKLMKMLTNTLDDLNFKEITLVNSDLFSDSNQPHAELHRGVEAVNWMLKFPWILESGTSESEGLDYYFSDTRPLHKFFTIEIADKDNTSGQGFVVFSISQKTSGSTLKTLDYNLKDPTNLPGILALAVKFGKQYMADSIEIPEEVACSFNFGILGKFLLREKKRIYQCYPKSEVSPLAEAWSEIELHLYDGDMAFS